MAYKATQEVVQRVRPLLDRLATRTIDKARLLQYLSAMAGVDWGILRLTGCAMIEDDGQEIEILTLEDVMTSERHHLHYPACLPRDLDQPVREEYKRLALNRRLTPMNQPLFDYLFGASHCATCRYAGAQHAQIHLECRYAGRPINYEPEDVI